MVSANEGEAPDSFGQLVDWASTRLASSSSSPRLDAELLVASVAGIRRSAVLAYPERRLGGSRRERFTELVQRRLSGVPLAYLTGTREFFSLELVIRAGVLVPRPETELLVEQALAQIGTERSVEILDLGTGCGAIALALKDARPLAEIAAVDLSATALAVARENGERLGLAVSWLESDWFAAVAGRSFDLIVANPPYVASGDPLLAGDLRHEPALALDGGEDGLAAIRAIVAGARAHMKPGGRLLVEHGYDQGPAVLALARGAGFADAETLKDLAGHDRALDAVA
jgi:release factor glutamine methyltransferase